MRPPAGVTGLTDGLLLIETAAPAADAAADGLLQNVKRWMHELRFPENVRCRLSVCLRDFADHYMAVCAAAQQHALHMPHAPAEQFWQQPSRACTAGHAWQAAPTGATAMGRRLASV